MEKVTTGRQYEPTEKHYSDVRTLVKYKDNIMIAPASIKKPAVNIYAFDWSLLIQRPIRCFVYKLSWESYYELLNFIANLYNNYGNVYFLPLSSIGSVITRITIKFASSGRIWGGLIKNFPVTFDINEEV